jgi:hypothetical protein
MSLIDWKIYCVDESKWVETLSINKPTECPNNAGHTIRAVREINLGPGEINIMSNIGVTGADIFLQKTGVGFELRGLIAGDNITLVEDAQNITINSTGGGGLGETNTVSNIGTGGIGLFKQKTGVDFEFKKINSTSATSGITIVDDTGNNEVDIRLDLNSLTLDATPDGAADYVVTYDASATGYKKVKLNDLPNAAGGETNTASNIGVTGADIFYQKTGTDLEFRGLLGGTGITLVENAQNITINSTGGISSMETILVYDKKTSGTNGGTFTSGSWVTRDLNTLDQSGTEGSLSNNEITLQPGKYHFCITAPGYQTNNHQIRLYNVTDSVVVKYGTSEFAKSGSGRASQSFSRIHHYVDISTAKTYRVEHRCDTTNPNNGLGIATGFGGDEIYTEMMINKF